MRGAKEGEGNGGQETGRWGEKGVKRRKKEGRGREMKGGVEEGGRERGGGYWWYTGITSNQWKEEGMGMVIDVTPVLIYIYCGIYIGVWNANVLVKW